MSSITVSDTLAWLSLVITLIATLFAFLVIIELTRLRKIRTDFNEMRDAWKKDQHRVQKAQQRVVASYNISDVDRRIALLKTAVETDPATFNGYNALGYAYLEKGDRIVATDAFQNAIRAHPDAKEGYFDLAYIYLNDKRPDLVKTYLGKAIEHDPSALDDINGDERLKPIYEEPHPS